VDVVFSGVNLFMMNFGEFHAINPVYFEFVVLERNFSIKMAV